MFKHKLINSKVKKISGLSFLHDRVKIAHQDVKSGCLLLLYYYHYDIMYICYPTRNNMII